MKQDRRPRTETGKDTVRLFETVTVEELRNRRELFGYLGSSESSSPRAS